VPSARNGHGHKGEAQLGALQAASSWTATPTSPVSASAATIEKVTRRILPRMPTRRALLQAGAALAFAGPHRFAGRQLKHELRLLQWAHPTPGYDAWLARRAARWGQAHDARVTIDHVNSSELAGRARAELATKRGHDLVQLLAPPTVLQTETAPLNDAVAEVTRRLGKPAPVALGSAYNPRTGRWFAFPEHYVPLAFVRRTDLWRSPPASWQDVVEAAPALGRRARPVAIGLSDELDSTTANLSLLLAHGGRLDRLGAPPTVAYLRAVTGLYQDGMPGEVLDWTPFSNNQLLLAGRASLIVNPRSVLTAPHRGLPLAATPLPERSVPHVVACTILWPFSSNRELAQRWLVDQQLDYAAHERASRLNVSAWHDDGRTVAAGSPGPTNGAVQELLESSVLTRTARHVAVGRLTPEEGARQAAAEAEPIFRRWRDAKLI
jgi:multiple sugar transport system substrate-binding protein